MVIEAMRAQKTPPRRLYVNIIEPSQRQELFLKETDALVDINAIKTTLP
jgi:hypothetical protein